MLSLAYAGRRRYAPYGYKLLWAYGCSMADSYATSNHYGCCLWHYVTIVTVYRDYGLALPFAMHCSLRGLLPYSARTDSCQTPVRSLQYTNVTNATTDYSVLHNVLHTVFRYITILVIVNITILLH